MMKSEDKDNLYLATLTIKNLRDLRIKEYGIYSNENEKYNYYTISFGFGIIL